MKFFVCIVTRYYSYNLQGLAKNETHYERGVAWDGVYSVDEVVTHQLDKARGVYSIERVKHWE
jgi:hypothetical protein